jgi:hypothetical protein
MRNQQHMAKFKANNLKNLRETFFPIFCIKAIKRFIKNKERTFIFVKAVTASDFERKIANDCFESAQSKD